MNAFAEIIHASPVMARIAWRWACLTTLGMAVSQVAQGQDREASATSANVFEEIIVTARNIEESLQDVPLAVTAFTAEDLARRDIMNLQDVALLTPGFTFEDFSGGLGRPVIRGATQQVTSVPEQNVSVFFDGIYLPRPFTWNLGYNNLERIEVVKGPQSARYGRNAFSGAINYIPKRPGDEFHATVRGAVGSDDRYDGEVYVSVPVIDEILSVSGSYSYKTFDGAWSNNHPFRDISFTQGTGDNMGGWRKDAFSFAARLTPNDRLSLDLSVHDFDERYELPATQALTSLGRPAIGGNALNCGGVAFGSLRAYCGELPGIGVFGVDPRTYGPQTDVEILRGGLQYDFGSDWTGSYTFGRVEADTAAIQSFEPNPVTGGVFGFGVLVQNSPIQAYTQTQQELRIGFRGQGKVSGSFGGFYSDNDDDQFFVTAILPPLAATPGCHTDTASRRVCACSAICSRADQPECQNRGLVGVRRGNDSLA